MEDAEPVVAQGPEGDPKDTGETQAAESVLAGNLKLSQLKQRATDAYLGTSMRAMFDFGTQPDIALRELLVPKTAKV
jgi:hypothetical protein